MSEYQEGVVGVITRELSEWGVLREVAVQLGRIGAIIGAAIPVAELTDNAVCIMSRWTVFNDKLYAGYVPAILYPERINEETYNELARGDNEVERNLNLLRGLARQGILVFNVAIPEEKVPANVKESGISTVYTGAYYLGGMPNFAGDPPTNYYISQFDEKVAMRYRRGLINKLGLRPNAVQLLPVKGFVEHPSPNPKIQNLQCLKNLASARLVRIVIMPNFTPRMNTCVKSVTAELYYRDSSRHIVFNTRFSACFTSTPGLMTNTPFLIPFVSNMLSSLQLVGEIYGVGPAFLNDYIISPYRNPNLVEIDDTDIGAPVYYPSECLTGRVLASLYPRPECGDWHLVGFLSGYFKLNEPLAVEIMGKEVELLPGIAIYGLVPPPREWTFDALMEWARERGTNVDGALEITKAIVALQALRDSLAASNPQLASALYSSLPVVEELLHIDVKGLANDIVNALRASGVAGVVDRVRSALGLTGEELRDFAEDFTSKMRLYGYG